MLPMELSPALSNPALDVMNFLNEVSSRFPEAISFAAGRPCEDFFHVEASLQSFASMTSGLARPGDARKENALATLCQYGRTNGLFSEAVAKMLAIDEGIHVGTDDLILTVGCQEAMLICLLGLCDPQQDVVLISDPAYVGLVGASLLTGREVRPVASTSEGLNLQDLESQILAVKGSGKRVKLLYLIPNFSNPDGSCLSLERRHALLSLAKKHDFFLLEDNAYGIFSYDGAPPPSLKSLDKDERVLLAGTFAKSVYPGLRLGYLVADQKLQQPGGRQTSLAQVLSKVKSMTTVNTSPLVQGILASVLLECDYSLKKRNVESIAFYKRNRDVLDAALEAAFPPDFRKQSGISWQKPAGGFFLTLTLPFEITESLLLTSAERFGVIWVPMRYFHLKESNLGARQIRLSFSAVHPDQIRQGVERLAAFVRSQLDQP